MLNFLRKFQKAFFFVIAFAVIVSFVFYGAYSRAQGEGDKPKKKLVAKAVNGSSIYSDELGVLSLFISSSFEERNLGFRKRNLNYLNDGVIENDFLKTGLAKLLYAKYQDKFSSVYKAKEGKIKGYKPYAHPQVNYIRAEEVWKHFVPNFGEHYQKLHTAADTTSLESFDALVNLYLDQLQFPPEMLERVINYQQSQSEWIQKDPSLNPERLALFGYKSLDDWFGREFIDAISQFIINASIIAEEKGYKVSKDEVRADLLQKAYLHFKEFAKEPNFGYNEAHAYMKDQLQILGISESQAIDAWKKVMLFRRLFNDLPVGIGPDELTLKELASFAGETVEVTTYQPAKQLRLNKFRDMLKLQFYIDAVSNEEGLTQLPTSFKSVSEVADKFPQLVVQKFSVEMAKVAKEDLTNEISLSDTWDWQLEEVNFKKLCKEFPILAKGDISTEEQRAKILDALSQEERLRIDHYTRMQLVEANPEAVQQALKTRSSQKKELVLSLKEAIPSLDGIENTAELVALLNQAGLSSDKAVEAQSKLDFYTQDGQHYYSFKVLETSNGPYIRPFDEVKEEKVLGVLLDEKLKAAYPVVRKNNPDFLNEDKTYKSFEDVKDLVGVKVYQNVLDKIKEMYLAAGNSPSWKGEAPSLEFYFTHRFFGALNSFKKDLVANPDKAQNSIIVKGSNIHPFEAQWKLVKEDVKVERGSKVSLDKELVFGSKEGFISGVNVASHGEAYFFVVNKRYANEKAYQEAVEKLTQKIAVDAKRGLMQEMLTTISNKNAIVITAKE